MLLEYFLLFIVFSFVGGILDFLHGLIISRKERFSGFLGFPFCTLYGFGAILVILLIGFISDLNIFFRSIIYIVSLTGLEYITALLCENVYKKKCWDYSENHFNFQGRIELRHSLYWIILALLFERFVYPFFNKFIGKLDHVSFDIQFGIVIICSLFIFGIFIKKHMKDRKLKLA